MKLCTVTGNQKKLEKQKIGATISFPEGLENTPFTLRSMDWVTIGHLKIF
jgi:hypothetical protein